MGCSSPIVVNIQPYWFCFSFTAYIFKPDIFCVLALQRAACFLLSLLLSIFPKSHLFLWNTSKFKWIRALIRDGRVISAKWPYTLASNVVVRSRVMWEFVLATAVQINSRISTVLEPISRSSSVVFIGSRGHGRLQTIAFTCVDA